MTMYDLMITGGRVIDTKTCTSSILNIGVKDGKIAYAGTKQADAKVIVNASGKYVCPGFIDVHAHIDGHLYSGELSACQGITTTIGGNCGLSPLDIGHFIEKQNAGGFYINQMEFIGHSFTLRHAVGLKNNYRKADAGQIRQMAAMAEEALDSGACGVSFGLDYAPGTSLEEMRVLCELAARKNKLMAVHTRLFTDKDMNSLYEILAVAKATGVRVLISHFVYQYGNGCMEEALRIVDKARSEGLDIYIDSGMYTDWSTYVGTETYSEDVIKDNGYVFGDFVVATGKYTGRRMTKEIYDELRNFYPDDSVICFTGKKDEIRMALKAPYAMPSTDAGAYDEGEGHPQIAGTYPKYFIEMVREHKDLTIEEAVSKASLLPAKVFKIQSKGSLETGMDADIVVLDLTNLIDHAAFPHLGRPDGKPEGIDEVIVGGGFVVHEGKFTKNRPGRIVQ